MVNNLNSGPLEVFSNDPAEINLQFARVRELIDGLSGLRGRSMIWDEARVDSPTQQTSAVDLQSLLDQKSITRLDWITHPGIPVLAPGTSYAEISSLFRQNIDFSSLTAVDARVIISGFGTGSGSGKGVCIHDGSNVLAEVTWDGNSEGVQTGDFTTIPLTADTSCQLRVKGSSTAENIILHWVVVEFRVTIKVITS